MHGGLQIKSLQSTSVRRSLFWQIYFLLSIVVIGAVGAYIIGAPLYLLGRRFIWARRLAERINVKAIGFMMRSQPWYDIDAKLERFEKATLEDRPLLLVSNHRSNLDSFVLLSLIRGVHIFQPTKGAWSHSRRQWHGCARY
jgi:1-acyl-sn-glycerol-3-phosphate acyltransferase